MSMVRGRLRPPRAHTVMVVATVLAVAGLVLALGSSSRPRAVVGALPTPTGWVTRTDPVGAVSYAIPAGWQTVASSSPGPGAVGLDAALKPGSADFEDTVIPLLLEPGEGPAVSIVVNAPLATELGIGPGDRLDEAVQSAALWANRGWTGLFIELGCEDTAPRPFVGVGLRGLAWDFRGCHGTASSVRTFVAVDKGGSVVVVGWLLARTDRDRAVLDPILGSLRVRGYTLEAAGG